MTKEEFIGFSSAAQHDMVLEALVRVTKNLEIIEKASGKPFAGTAKQNANDIKLLTILAEAFGKNELVWNHHDEILSRGAALDTGIGQKIYAEKPRAIVNAGRLMPRDKVMSQFALYTGLGQKVHTEEATQPWNPVPMIEESIDNSKGIGDPIKDIMDAKKKIEGALQRSGHFMSCEENKES